MNKLFIYLILGMFLISLTSAINFGYNYLDNQQTTSTTNYSAVNVNNSLYWQGHTGTDGSWLTGIGGGNNSWNQSLANTLYAGIQWGYNQTYSGSTYNATYNTWAYNQSQNLTEYAKYQFTNNNLNGSGNITASYFYGNGSKLDSVNATYFQDYTPTTLKTWIQGAFNSVYCLLTGCTMSGNINMSGNNLTSVKNIYVTNSSYGVYSNSTDVVYGYIGGLS